VVRVLDNHLNDELDIPIGEIQLLGDAVNQFILWHRRDIVLTVAPLTYQSNSQSLPPVMEDQPQPNEAKDDDWVNGLLAQ
jgi:hypothetical protein